MQTVCKTYFPPKYKSKLDVRQTVAAIKFLKVISERQLADELNLTGYLHPFFVRPETGLNDNLWS